MGTSQKVPNNMRLSRCDKRKEAVKFARKDCVIDPTLTISRNNRVAEIKYTYSNLKVICGNVILTD